MLRVLSSCSVCDKAVLVVRNPPANAGDLRDTGLIPGLRRFPWRRAWQPTLVFSPGEFHGQEELAGSNSSWGCKELDMTERLHFNFFSEFKNN